MANPENIVAIMFLVKIPITIAIIAAKILGFSSSWINPVLSKKIAGKDIAEKLGTIGYLTALTRIKVGKYSINESLSIESFMESWKSINH